MARAESQLTITLATQKELLLLSEVDLMEAELSFLRMSTQLELQKRLIARGINTSDTFVQQNMAVKAAEKKLELMRLRYDTQRILQGISKKEPASEPRQPSTPIVEP